MCCLIGSHVVGIDKTTSHIAKINYFLFAYESEFLLIASNFES